MQNQITAVPENGKETQAQLSAGLLRDALWADHDIPADTHDGHDLALVSVWVGLVVWCDGVWFWWRAGWDDRRKRVVYARHPTTEPSRAARRVAFRYADLRRRQPAWEVIDDLPSAASLSTCEGTE
ncbi:hypothetical protein HTZ77_19070 [Nonomuraea sp. SMC257]|uniref:Uncharacterized protein n=1 Tax=Nonomuraea montanisoli TaxID=2741721 RepID=A0A7Y6I8T3_9ACTN|nr:hypothetical protein [Nonomuraea montanisoli]NUW33516.1 hypothetical protein [Nonomuraea montanisoli]